MCLIFVAYEQHPRYRLIAAANRDELYTRPTAPARFWEDAPRILAGRDLQGGGTWLGVSRSGRFAALTNFRDSAGRTGAPSRGVLVRGFLAREDDTGRYIEEVGAAGQDYNGFGLLLFDGATLGYCSNRSTPRSLPPGLYGLSNHLLDTPWPKLERGKRLVRACIEGPAIDTESLLSMMQDRVLASDQHLPDTGIDEEVERSYSPIFIETGAYGTRSTTLVLMDFEGGVTFIERTYVPHRDESETVAYHLSVGPTRQTVAEHAGDYDRDRA